MIKLINDIFSTVFALIFTLSTIAGGGMVIRKVYYELKRETLTKIHRGLPSLEKMTQRMTGKKLDI